VRTQDGFLHLIDARSNTVVEQIRAKPGLGEARCSSPPARSGPPLTMLANSCAYARPRPYGLLVGPA
jgi:hypothetical protein